MRLAAFDVRVTGPDEVTLALMGRGGEWYQVHMTLQQAQQIGQALFRGTRIPPGYAPPALVPASSTPAVAPASSPEPGPAAPSATGSEAATVLSVGEVAKLLRCGQWAVYELCRTGQIRHVRVGRLIRIPRSAVEEFLARPPEHHREPAVARTPLRPSMLYEVHSVTVGRKRPERRQPPGAK
ncbi:MAG: excisionase family DNA-binding protein [Bacillota bacterium]